MLALPNTNHLLTLSRIYCEAVNRSEVRVADLAAGNPYFFRRLRSGGGCTITTYNRVLQWFSDHWPPGLEWPEDIPRPEPSVSADGPKDAA